MGERIAPHTKEDLEKKISNHYILQLLPVYTSVTSLVQLACFLKPEIIKKDVQNQSSSCLVLRHDSSKTAAFMQLNS